MKRILALFTIAIVAATAVAASVLFPVTMKLTDAANNAAPDGIGQIITTILTNVVANPVSAVMTGNYLSILCWAIIFGMGFKKLASKETRNVVADFAAVVSKAVFWI